MIKSLLPAPVARALEACKPHFGAAALFSALINILYLAPTIYMMQVYDRVVPTGGVITLFWITAVLAVAIATLTAFQPAPAGWRRSLGRPTLRFALLRTHHLPCFAKPRLIPP